MELSYEYQIYTNAVHREAIARTFGCCRFVYKHALEIRRGAYQAGSKVPCINRLYAARTYSWFVRPPRRPPILRAHGRC